MKKISVAGPWITGREISLVTDAVTNAWYDNAGSYNTRFEEAFADYIGRRYAVTLPSCTSAIHLSLLALGVGPGDEVIVPDLTWIATAAPISYVGATPIFADIDPETWCISPESFKEYITPGTKAIIPVDLYGGMPDMDSLKEIALRHKIAIIEDAAEAIGSKYKGRRAGSFGDTGVFSFHGSKTLTTGEGGMLVTDREDLYRRVLFLRDHGRAPGSKLFYNSQVAYKYKMSSLQAALGLAQLERVDELVEKKRLIFSWYRRELEDIKDITLNPESPGTVNSCWMVTIVVDEELGLTKERLMAELEKKDIDSRPFFYPLSSLPAYDEVSSVIRSRRDNKDAYRLSPYGINLPSALNLTESQVEYVAEALRSILSRSY